MTVAQELTRMPMERAIRIMEAPGTPFPFGRNKNISGRKKAAHVQKHTLEKEMQKLDEVFNAMTPGRWQHFSDIGLNYSDAYMRRVLNDLHGRKKIKSKTVSKVKYYKRPAE